MTFAQLRSFATVARLGSVKAAAESLGVSEPAVSAAVGELRRDLGDELFVRSGGGIRLTPGGARLAAAAAEILGLAERVRHDVRAIGEERSVLRLAAAADVAEFAAAPLLDAFTRRRPALEVSLRIERVASFAGLLADRRADVTLGPPPDQAPGVASLAFLRFGIVVVAAPGHRLAGRRGLRPAALERERWLVGPSGDDPGSPLGAFLAAHRVAPRDTRAFATESAAQAAAAAGRGVMPAISHTVLDQLRRGTLVRLDVEGTPVNGLWHAGTLSADRRSAAAAALTRFLTTPEATQALLARPGGVPAGRFRPPVYVTIWS